MDRAGRWFRSFLGGKKEQVGNENEKKKKKPPVAVPAGKERRRWSFRLSVDGNRMKEVKSAAAVLEIEYDDQKRHQHALAIAAATKAASEAAEAAAQAAAVVISLTSGTRACRPTVFQTHSAVKIQAVFRSYLARKALRALQGIVKLQSLIRGQLLRTLFKIPAIANTNTKCRPPRFLTGKEAQVIMTMISHRQLEVKIPSHRHRTSSSPSSSPRRHYHHQRHHHHNRMECNAGGGHFEETASFKTAKSSSSPHHHHQSYYRSAVTSLSDSIDDTTHCVSGEYCNYAVSNPSYMANTQSSKAKARSQSTPRLRPCSPSRRSLMGSVNEGDYTYQRSLLPYD